MTSPSQPGDAGDEALDRLRAWVRSELTSGRQVGCVDVISAVCHPRLPVVACDVEVATKHDGVRRLVAVLDIESGELRTLDGLGEASGRPAWSPDGAWLAAPVTVDDLPTVRVVPLPAQSTDVETSHQLPEVGGAVEWVGWSPDGTRLAVVVAQRGAELSDVVGSGTVAQEERGGQWRPLVSPSAPGRRSLRLWRPGSASTSVLAADLNVWQAAWSSPEELVVLCSEGAGEGSWYSAHLASLSVGGSRTVRHRPEAQLAQPSAATDGSHWSVLSSPASDRGLLAGTLLIGSMTETTPPSPVDTGGVDVTDHHWLDERRVLYAGIRRQDTVFGVVDVETKTRTELLVTDGTSGRHQPALGGMTPDHDLLVVLERHDLPPTVCTVRGGERRIVLSTAGPGTDHVVATTGSTTPTWWHSSDGLEIGGLLSLPAGQPPFPLVVNVHGGPVGAWLDGWIAREPFTRLLLHRGFAVLRPNPRGSAGRGAAYIEPVLGDIGGLDVDDVTSGVDVLVSSGVVDAHRVGITGNSYGGYMAAWVPCRSDAFAAAVARSPVTDWLSQHLTSNLAEFDRIVLTGDPFDRESSYTTRSPLQQHRRIDTPMLLTAGALDLATPPTQAQQLHRALLEHGVPTQLAVYPQEGHGVRGRDSIVDQLARTISWFERHLLPSSPPGDV